MKSCCIIGHKEIEYSIVFEEKIGSIVKDLIVNHGVNAFLFGSNSKFNDLCYGIVRNLREIYPQIKLIFYSRRDEIAKKGNIINIKAKQNLFLTNVLMKILRMRR